VTTGRQLDNSTLGDKVRLRRAVLLSHARHCEKLAGEPLGRDDVRPRVLETHGGYGRIFERTWFAARAGSVVIEKDDRKAEHLAVQRPAWRVYQGDCVKALRAGLAAEVAFDIIDLDPYGEPFSVLDALAAVPARAYPQRWYLVVNDGNRQKVMMGGAWHMESLAPFVRKYGTNLHGRYLAVCREWVETWARRIGFNVETWTGYYAGRSGMMSHYAATLARA
jgi:hypothetical protein